MILKRVLWYVFAGLSIAIGLYPIGYFFIDSDAGLLSTKDALLLSSVFWNIGFYVHISMGGLALLVGWIQFSVQFRNKNLSLHRSIGKVYIFSVFLAAIAGACIGFFATGGPIAATGFVSLGVIWFVTTISAYQSARTGHIRHHQKMMIYSYAACFAAVTLRLWLPLLSNLMGGFIPAYRMVAWLCWVPNLVVAYALVKKLDRKAIA